MRQRRGKEMIANTKTSEMLNGQDNKILSFLSFLRNL